MRSYDVTLFPIIEDIWHTFLLICYLKRFSNYWSWGYLLLIAYCRSLFVRPGSNVELYMCRTLYLLGRPKLLSSTVDLDGRTLHVPNLKKYGGDSHMKAAGMLFVSLRGVNFRFWYRLGCSG